MSIPIGLCVCNLPDWLGTLRDPRRAEKCRLTGVKLKPDFPKYAYLQNQRDPSGLAVLGLRFRRFNTAALIAPPK